MPGRRSRRATEILLRAPVARPIYRPLEQQQPTRQEKKQWL